MLVFQGKKCQSGQLLNPNLALANHQKELWRMNTSNASSASPSSSRKGSTSFTCTSSTRQQRARLPCCLVWIIRRYAPSSSSTISMVASTSTWTGMRKPSCSRFERQRALHNSRKVLLSLVTYRQNLPSVSTAPSLTVVLNSMLSSTKFVYSSHLNKWSTGRERKSIGELSPQWHRKWRCSGTFMRCPMTASSTSSLMMFSRAPCRLSTSKGSDATQTSASISWHCHAPMDLRVKVRMSELCNLKITFILRN